MRRGKKSLALMLAVAMVLSSVPVSAAPMNASSYTSGWFGDFWNNLFNWNWNNNWNDSSDDTVVEEPETEVPEEQELVVVEDATTVENGDLLRASTYNLETVEAGAETEAVATYSLSTAAETADESTESTNQTVLKYFNTTMYDYDADTINAATDKLDNDLTVREGIYFSTGSPTYEKTTTDADMSAFVAGQYYIQNIRAAANGVGSWIYSYPNDTTIRGTANQSDATLWTLVIEDGEYYLKSGDKYLVIGDDGEGNEDGLTETKTAITISAFAGDARGVQLSQKGYYLCQWGGKDSIYYGGYNVNNDGGNGMLFYPVDDAGNVRDIPITPGETTTYISAGYEEWNRWDKATDDVTNGQKMYTGLVKSTLDANKDIVFTKTEGGIFSSDATVKSIYPGVEMPFVFKNGYYTFDASVNGVYFKEDTTQKSTATAEYTTDASGTRVAPRMYFDEGNAQSNGGSYGDGSTTVWSPFNSSTSFSESDMNYYFGMRTTIPFSMTSNGRIVETSDSSEPITFSFSGDDDVWVFIDGHLVIDLGGIHNRLDAKIDFQTNTVTYSESNSKETVILPKI